MTQDRQLDPERLGDHLDRLYRAAWALCGSREDAEDLVQETYAAVLRKPRRLRSDDDLGYLLRVLRNTFFSGRRAAARRVRVPREAEAGGRQLPLLDDVRDDARVGDVAGARGAGEEGIPALALSFILAM